MGLAAQISPLESLWDWSRSSEVGERFSIDLNDVYGIGLNFFFFFVKKTSSIFNLVALKCLAIENGLYVSVQKFCIYPLKHTDSFKKKNLNVP